MAGNDTWFVTIMALYLGLGKAAVLQQRVGECPLFHNDSRLGPVGSLIHRLFRFGLFALLRNVPQSHLLKEQDFVVFVLCPSHVQEFR